MCKKLSAFSALVFLSALSWLLVSCHTVPGTISPDLGGGAVDTGAAIGGAGASIDASVSINQGIGSDINQAIGQAGDAHAALDAGASAGGEIQRILRVVRERVIVDYKGE